MASQVPPEALRTIFHYLAIPSTTKEKEFGFRRGDPPRFRGSAAAVRRDLWSCSLVCKAWAQWAQEALYTDVVLQKLTCVWFMETLEARPDLASKVTTLEISPPFSTTCLGTEVKALLSILRNLRWYRVHLKKQATQEGCQDYLPTSFNARLERISIKARWLDQIDLQQFGLSGLPSSLKRLDLAAEPSLSSDTANDVIDDLAPLDLPALANLEIVGMESSLVLEHCVFPDLSHCPKVRRMIITGCPAEDSDLCTILLQRRLKQLKTIEYLSHKPRLYVLG
ncbi:hypothetical protein P389DRAFT_203502 [Cystobasidium minutum MCA 4210]|uniref:uncharacterized protein n=1 Tax=Cystobasidium minutum MCA 4210 TaxID=1397322 RepID=UPI0034CDB477|eukprot:jgi/Rhomi1/203502/MIX4331_64_100